MKITLLTLILAFSTFANAVDIASCSNPDGYAYYAQAGVVRKADSGWKKDGITGGKINVVMDDKNKYDLLYIDTQKGINSSKADGAQLLVIRASSRDFVLLISYSTTSELYSFWKDDEGKFQYSHLQSKGAGLAITKSSVMVGRCDYIDFNAVK